MANKPTPSRLADQYKTYGSASEAAVAALRGIDNKQAESGGGILFNKEQGKYAATEPVGQSDGSHFQAAVSVPKGWALHSTYHTHPSGPQSKLFSDDDINTSTQLKAPSYVLARDDDKVRMFDPAKSTVSKDMSGGKFSPKRFSPGSVVDETPPAPPVADTPAPAPPPAASAPAATVPVAGSRITMREFVDHHRAQTTKYKHKIVHIK